MDVELFRDFARDYAGCCNAAYFDDRAMPAMRPPHSPEAADLIRPTDDRSPLFDFNDSLLGSHTAPPSSLWSGTVLSAGGAHPFRSYYQPAETA